MAAIVLQGDNTLPNSDTIYTKVSQFREAVTVPAGTKDADVIEAIREAERLIDAYTGRLFGLRAVRVLVRVGSDGKGFLPDPMREITDVRWTGMTEALPAGVWAYNPAPPQEPDWISVGHPGGYDDLVVGAERTSGGWANLYRGREIIEVTGKAGSGFVPLQVTKAANALTAMLLGIETTAATTTPDDMANVKSLAREGYKVEYFDPATAAGAAVQGVHIPTTGLAEADRLLTSQVRRSNGWGVA